MKISLNWLKEFVEVPFGPERLKSDLTGVGLNVESLTPSGDDWIFDIEVTTNRPDCLSHHGIAREVAAIYRKPLGRPEVRIKESARTAVSEITIEIANPELCPRYCGRVLRGVKVGPSPAWLERRLAVAGARPINNVTDVTNYVLMELGHPLHAFDLERLGQKKIIVRKARPGERLRTLDGEDRKLGPENLTIADGERAVALAGVMGGEDSGISAGTSSVMLESAWFNPVSVRRTAKAHGLHTEASHRFERGADIEMAPVALDRAAALITELAGGEVLKGIVDVYPAPPRRSEILLRPSEIVRLLGAELEQQLGAAPAAEGELSNEVERLLSALGFKIERQGAEGWRVAPPSFRLDVTHEVDLVEEIARHYGYDRLPARVRPAPPSSERDQTREKELAVSATLVGLGYRETMTTSMVDPEENARFTDRPPVVLANPLSQEASALRSSTVPSMLRSMRWNFDRDRVDLRFFEVGRTYTARPGDLPEERRTLTLGLSGHRHPPSLHEAEREMDFFDLKGDLETLFGLLDLPNLRFEPAGCHYYESGSSGRLTSGGSTLAVLGQLGENLARDYKLRAAVWLAEVDLERLLGFPLKAPAFRPVSRFPAVERDFSLVISEQVSYSRIEEALRSLSGEVLRGYKPMDIFRGGTIPPGTYSLLLRVTFQRQDRTLTSEEISEASGQVLSALEPLGISLRT